MKTKKFLGAILTAFVLLLTSFVFVACGEDEAVKFAKIEGLATEVCVGGNYDTSNAKVTIELKSGKTIEVTADDLTFGALDTTTVGNKVLSISYGKDEKMISYNFAVEVYQDEEVAIHSVTGVRSSITVGEEYLTDDAVVMVRYRSGRTVDVTDQATFSAVNTAVAGNVEVTVSYKTFEYKYTVVVYVQEDVSATRVVGQYASELDFGEEFDKSNIELELTYTSGRKEVINNSYLTISDLDMYSFDEQTFTVTYVVGNESHSAQGRVTINKTYMIFGLDNPTFVDVYKRNSQRKNTNTATGVNGIMGFEDLNNPYIVGNENAFIFEPKLSVMYANGDVGELAEYKATYKVYLVEGEQNNLLSGDTLASYVAVDQNKHELQFTKASAGRTFKISVLPTFVDDDEEVDEIEFTFNVVDGYNVYTSAELSLFDNYNYNNKWTSYKQAHGISVDAEISGLILQNDITITKDDIPAYHIWQESEVAGALDAQRAVGSLKDADSDELGMVYSRILDKNETFTFEGNYFQISAQNVPIIVREDGKQPSADPYIVITHTALFSIQGRNYEDGEAVDLEDVPVFNMNNIELNGNTKKTDDETLSGGVIFMKKRNCVTNYYNNLAKCWFISYFSRASVREEAYAGHEELLPLNLTKVNAFDDFNCLLYVSAGVVNMEDCTFIGAGGPVMICDHSDHNEDGTGGIISDVFVTNCKLESWVSGREGWFTSFEGASLLAAQIVALNRLTSADAYKVGIANGDKMNFIALYKSGKDADMSDRPINGYFTVDGYDFKLDASKTLVKLFIDMVYEMGGFDEMAAAMGVTAETIAQRLKGAIALQTYDGSFGYTSETDWAITPDLVKAICASAIPMLVDEAMDSPQVQAMIGQMVDYQMASSEVQAQITAGVNGYIAQNYPNFNELPEDQQEQIRTAVTEQVTAQVREIVTEAVETQARPMVEAQVRQGINTEYGEGMDAIIDAISEADFANASGYINVYLPVGMSIVLGATNLHENN